MRFESKFDVSKRYVIEVDGNFYPSTEFELHQMYLQIGKELGLLSDDATMPTEPEPSPYSGEHSMTAIVSERIRALELAELRKEIEELKRAIAELRLQQPVVVPMPYPSPWGPPYLQPIWSSETTGSTLDVYKLAREVSDHIKSWRK